MSTVDELANEIATLAAHLDAATQRLLACIRAFDDAGGWARQGAVSCAHWLSWRVGLDLATAREKVRVARALGRLPLTDAAFSRGELSYAKVRAITRVATSDNEQRLLELSRYSTGAQLERICRSYRQVVRSLTDEGALPEERTFRERILPGGMVKIELVLHPDEAALVRQAFERAQDHLRAEQEGTSATPAGSDETHASAEESSTQDHLQPHRAKLSSSSRTGQQTIVTEGRPSLVEAAVTVAQTFLSQDTDNTPRTGGDRFQIFVHLDEDVLATDGSWVGTLDNGTRLPAETLLRVACDAGLVPTRTDRQGTILDVGRRTRTIPPAIRRALWLRDRGCRYPGCDRTRFLHGHHIQHWLSGGPTRLDNLVLLCHTHHTLVHEGHCSIETTEGNPASLIFRTSDGERLPAIPTPAAIEDAESSLRIWAAEKGIEIGPDTSLPWWDGAMPDYDWVVSSLLPAPVTPCPSERGQTSTAPRD